MFSLEGLIISIFCVSLVAVSIVTIFNLYMEGIDNDDYL